MSALESLYGLAQMYDKWAQTGPPELRKMYEEMATEKRKQIEIRLSDRATAAEDSKTRAAGGSK